VSGDKTLAQATPLCPHEAAFILLALWIAIADTRSVVIAAIHTTAEEICLLVAAAGFALLFNGLNWRTRGSDARRGLGYRTLHQNARRNTRLGTVLLLSGAVGGAAFYLL
jgi:hypothetical protein